MSKGISAWDANWLRFGILYGRELAENCRRGNAGYVLDFYYKSGRLSISTLKAVIRSGGEVIQQPLRNISSRDQMITNRLVRAGLR